ncbi:hypothetical protein ZWY2020_038489 [Hordeum vulgare]|nr:hypothetical protein ZWY2020_038489 [Hordeum vulgare]
MPCARGVEPTCTARPPSGLATAAFRYGCPCSTRWRRRCRRPEATVQRHGRGGLSRSRPATRVTPAVRAGGDGDGNQIPGWVGPRPPRRGRQHLARPISRRYDGDEPMTDCG